MIVLNFSLVLWHELCLNAVGVVSELLLAWSKDAVNLGDVKKVLDVFRSKICALPVCIAAWLCSFIHVRKTELSVSYLFLTVMARADLN